MARWYINQDYFNLEQIKGEGLKNLYYILGAFYPCYRPIKENGMRFISTKIDLVKIVKEQLESKNSIIHYSSSNSQALRVKNVPKLVSKLEELGLEADKFKRKFPENIEEPYIDHFTRGFIDAQGVIFPTSDGNRLNLGIKLNREFDAALNEALRKYALVQYQTNLQATHIVYGFGDTMRILEFVYRDWDFIKESGLYLPKNYDLFTRYRESYPRENHQKRAAHKRVEKIKELILQGKSKLEVAKEVGYHKTGSLNRALKSITGKTITEFLIEHSLDRKDTYSTSNELINSGEIDLTYDIEYAEELFLLGFSKIEVAELTGFATTNSLERAFRREMGITITQFLKQSDPFSTLDDMV